MDIKKEFPILEKRQIVYLDNAATTQKPPCVIEAASRYYNENNANPLRGLYQLSIDATDEYENSRQEVADFIGAADKSEIIFTRNATESLNLVAYAYARNFLHEGDEVITTIAEHHSNMIPWQQACKATGAHLTYLYCEKDGTMTPEMLEKIISDKTKIVAVTQVSNVFGRVNDIKGFAEVAHKHGAILVADGAQSVPHIPVNVQDLDCDFLSFSGHKMYAPMGIGVLYGKKDLLEKMPPFLFGGEMIEYVTTEGATWAELPHKFEAGTVNAAGAAGLKAAIDFYKAVGFEEMMQREQALGRLAYDMLRKIPHLTLIGQEEADAHHGIFSFTLEGVHPHDISEILSSDGVCIRAGHHCAQVLMQRLKVNSTVRASLSFYNTEEEIRKLAESLKTVRRRMGYAE